MECQRHYSLLDRVCLGLDQAIRVLSNNAKSTGAHYPAANLAQDDLEIAEQQHSAGLMRVNHAGEICAQGLYHGQSIGSTTRAVQEKMQQAAMEEGDHLAWCQQRLDELKSHTSHLNPVWYLCSFAIGVIAGLIGEKWSLGFVVETERQVIHHLATHLQRLPLQDERSHKILQQMETDEAKHRDMAHASGAAELPKGVKQLMHVASTLMVKTAYWI